MTQEEIEAEGWEHTGGKLRSGAMQHYRKGIYMMAYSTDDSRLAILVADPASVNDYYTAPIFRGECDNIEDFRTICKLLKTNK